MRTSLGGLQDIVKALLRGLTDGGGRSKQEIVDALAEKGLGDALSGNPGLPWILDWMEQNLTSFPEHLPGVVSPAW